MEIVFRICLFLTGVLNLLPSLLAFLPERISKSYGITVPDVNYELILRHRAILFAIVGGMMIYSAISKKNYDLATIVGLVSMASFIVLYFLMGKNVNAELTKVMKADIVGVVILIIGYVLLKFKS